MPLRNLFTRRTTQEISLEDLYSQQEKLATEAFSDFKTMSDEDLHACAEGHLDVMLNILDDYGVIDLQSIPEDGKRNCDVIVPEPWSQHCIEMIERVGDISAFPKKLFKLKFAEDIGDKTQMNHSAACLARNSAFALKRVSQETSQAVAEQKVLSGQFVDPADPADPAEDDDAITGEQFEDIMTEVTHVIIEEQEAGLGAPDNATLH